MLQKDVPEIGWACRCTVLPADRREFVICHARGGMKHGLLSGRCEETKGGNRREVEVSTTSASGLVGEWVRIIDLVFRSPRCSCQRLLAI